MYFRSEKERKRREEKIKETKKDNGRKWKIKRVRERNERKSYLTAKVREITPGEEDEREDEDEWMC